MSIQIPRLSDAGAVEWVDPPAGWRALKIQKQQDASDQLASLFQYPGDRIALIAKPSGYLELRHWLHLPPCPQHPGERAAGWGSLPCDCRPYIEQHRANHKMAAVNWLIVAGGRAPCHPAWVRSLVSQAREAGVPVCFAGWGRYHPSTIENADIFLTDGGWDGGWLNGVPMVEAQGGRRLDTVEVWEVPEDLR